MKYNLKYFPYNLYETIFIYNYLLDMDGEPPSYGFASRVLERPRSDIIVNARRVEALGLGKVNKGGRPFSIAWLELNKVGADMYNEVKENNTPLALLADISMPPAQFVLKTVPGLNIVVLTRIDYMGMLDELRSITGTKHRSYSPDALGGTGGRSKASKEARRVNL